MDLTTQRLKLRALSMDDLDAVHELLCLPETDEFNTLGIPADLSASRKILEGWLQQNNKQPSTDYIRVITLKDSGRFTGIIGMTGNPKAKYKRAEVWYKLHKDLFGQGYATEALEAVLHFAFVTLGLHRIEAGCAVGNIGSRRVLEKAGMVQEGLSRKILPIRGSWVDAYKYAILDTDYTPR